MNITRHPESDGEVRLALAGELDMSTTDQLHQHVKHEFTGERPRLRRLVVDLAQVSFCDSTGLGALIEARNIARDHSAGFLVINPSCMTRRIMQVTGLLDLLTTTPPA